MDCNLRNFIGTSVREMGRLWNTYMPDACQPEQRWRVFIFLY